jgi:hypothetical protein
VEGLRLAVSAELAFLATQFDLRVARPPRSFGVRLFDRYERALGAVNTPLIRPRDLPPMGQGGPLDLVVCFSDADLPTFSKQAQFGAARFFLTDPGQRAAVATVVMEFFARGAERPLFVELAATSDMRSLAATKERIAVLAEEAIPRSFRTIVLGGTEELLRDATLVPPEKPEPSLVRAAVADVGNAVRKRTIPEEWFIGVRPIRGGRAPWGEPASYVPFEPPRGMFYADPFLFRRYGSTHLFFELGNYENWRGVIACTELDGEGRPGKVETVLDVGPHLAYPFVFQREGQIWMLPDRGTGNSLDLFRAVDYPRKWEQVATLISGVTIVDSTLFEEDGHLWLFANLVPHGGSAWDELHLFHADRVEGPWTPHPLNPVVVDSRRARPAGKLFRREGRLLRPSQDCSQSYGYRLVFNEIEKLTPNEYRERPLTALAPTWQRGLVGTHTYNSDGTFETIDARRQVLRLPERLAARFGLATD